MRDGVSLTDRKVDRPIISPTEFTQLNNLKAYLEFPRDLPVTQVTFPLCECPEVAEGFVSKIGVPTAAKTEPPAAPKAEKRSKRGKKGKVTLDLQTAHDDPLSEKVS